MSPMMVPAMTGPTPKTSVRVVPETSPGGELLAGVAQLGIQAAHVLGKLRSELGAGHFNGAGRGGRPEDPGGLSCGDLLGDAAGDQVAEHGVQPAGDLVAKPGRSRCRSAHTFSTARWSSAATSRQVLDRSAAIATDRASFGSFLSCRQPAAAAPGTRAPAGRPGPLDGGDELLGAAGPARQRPSTAQVRSGHAGAHRPASRPAQPGATGPRPAAPQRADHHRRVPPLCGSTLIISAVIERSKSSSGEWRTWRACLIPDLLSLVPLSSHATARPGRPLPLTSGCLLPLWEI